MVGADLGIGIVAACGAAACYEAGYVLQAFEARRAPPEEGLQVSLLGHLVRRWRWVAGGVVIAGGWVLQVVALQHAPITVVQPLLTLGLLLLLAFGARFLHEPVGRREVVSVLLVLLGVAAITAAAPGHAHAELPGPGLAAALAILAVAALAPYAQRALTGAALPMVLILSAGGADALSALASKLVADDISLERWGYALAWAVLAGTGFGIGLLSEMTVLRVRRATQVGPTVLVLQVVIPVLCAPLLGERWGGAAATAAIVIGLASVAVGTALLAGSRAVSWEEGPGVTGPVAAPAPGVPAAAPRAPDGRSAGGRASGARRAGPP